MPTDMGMPPMDTGTPVDPMAPGDVEPPTTTDPMDPALTVGFGNMRRLTPVEYSNTVRDLLGIESDVSAAFPGETGGELGFSNASAVQTVSTGHIEGYRGAARKLVEELFADDALRSRIVACDLAADAACLRTTLETFVPIAWRRPALPAEIDRLVALSQTEATRSGSAEEQLKLALRGVLNSAYFLFLVEKDPDPASAVPHRLNDYELAARLSYFLWSSMPDEALRQAAAAGTLQDEATLDAMVERMLADPKSEALADVFASEWLQLYKVPKHNSSTEVFPQTTDQVKALMVEESKLFFTDLIKNGGTIAELMDSQHAFVNAELAGYYGLQAPGTEFQRVPVAGTNRIGGVLGHASVLMTHSNSEVTSPVGRGAWVLENVLCTTPPPAPGDVVPEFMDLDPNLTERERLAAHREVEPCKSCHTLIDPIGLGLEAYDAVGQHRELDKGKPVDASGQLPGGETFNNAPEMVTLLAADKRLAACISKKLFGFALGRSPSPQDAAHLAALAPENNTTPLRTVVQNLARTEAFRSRRNLAPAAPGGDQ